MSTNIRHGYRVDAPGPGRPDLFALIATLRKALEPVRRTAYATELAARATTILDLEAVPDLRPGQSAPQPRTCSAIRAAADELSQAAATIAGGRRVPDADFSFQVAFLPDPAAPNGPVYALVYTERRDFHDVWEAMPGVREFAYWNNTDGPAHLSELQWQQRRETWDRVVGRDVPARRGLCWELPGTDYTLDPSGNQDAVAAAIPTLAERAREVARTRVLAVEVDPEDGRWTVRDPDAIAADVAVEAARVEPLLGPVTLDDLYERPAH